MGKKKALRLVKPDVEVFELKVTLLDTKPAIWRRFVMSSEASLGELHEVLQVVMGWTNSHLHQLMTKDGRRFKASNPYMDDLAGFDDFNEDMLLANEWTLGSLKKELKQKMAYEYDLGDGWRHAVHLVKARPVQKGESLPRCLAGKLACPPEDCGGVWGYYNLLEAIKDPDHEEHEDMTEWLGDGFDSEAFDIDEVNARL